MIPLDPILFRELPVIAQIIQDETWLEGERSGCQVTACDAVVRENVCRVILRVGRQLRESIEAQMEQARMNAAPASPWPTGDEAA